MQLVMGPEVTLVSSAEETAKDVYRTLIENDLPANPTCGSRRLRRTSSWRPVTPSRSAGSAGGSSARRSAPSPRWTPVPARP